MRILVTTTICLAMSSLLLTTAVGQKGDTKSSSVKDYVAGTHQSPLYGTFYYKCWKSRLIPNPFGTHSWRWDVTWKPTTNEGRSLLNRAYNIMRRYGVLKISGNTAEAKLEDSLMFYWSGIYCLIPEDDASYNDNELDSAEWLFLSKFTLDKSGKPVSASFFGYPYRHKHPLSVLSYQPFIPFTIPPLVRRGIMAKLLSDRYTSQSNIRDDIDAGVLFASNFGDDGLLYVMLDKPSGRSPSNLYRAKVAFIPSKITGFDTLKELRESTVIILEFRDSDGFLVGSETVVPRDWTSMVDKGKTFYLTYDAPAVYISGKATTLTVSYGVRKK
jgi:hypothetical protein